MNDEFRVEGDWPSTINLTRGWGRAVARPWNSEAPDGFLRLVRGRTDFLRSATEAVAARAGSGVFSPAMFSKSARIWLRAGYEEIHRLEVLELHLGVGVEPPRVKIEETPEPPWHRLMEIDRVAFRGFWRMSLDGLREALSSTRPSAVLIASTDDVVTGYAIVGSQWGTAYLQRVAVDPVSAGRGTGTDLVRAAVRWAQKTTAASMVLNVRSENKRALRVYERTGFSRTQQSLRILRYGDTTLLD